jgi:hypothetical protein
MATMRTAAALPVALGLLALDASAAQQRQSFRVGAVVARSGRLRTEDARLRLASHDAVMATIDSGRQHLAKGEVALPPGTITVTIHY